MRDDLIQAFTQDLPNVDPGKRRWALEEFARRCPPDALESIVRGDYCYEFIGPDPRTLGEYVAMYDIKEWAKTGKDMHLIYLSPYLERMELEFALGVVVHEIAHAWLKHGLPGCEGNPKDNDWDADHLACEWGFAREIEIRNRSMTTGQE